MRQVGNHITEQQIAFANHPFFRWLETTSSKDEVANAFAQLTFWVASFQDVLAINESKIETPALREMARQHRYEDRGDDRLFFDDLYRLGTTTLLAQQLFAKPTAPIRHAVYGLMSEAFSATSDAARLAFVVALDSARNVFFDATSDWVDRAAGIFNLKFFSRRDASHALDALDEMELDPDTRAACIAVVDRTYDAFFEIFDTLLGGITQVGQRSLVHYVAQYA